MEQAHFPYDPKLGVFDWKPRQYLGMSEIGYCPRKVWYRITAARELLDHKPRPLALDAILKMRRGNLLEPLVVKALESCGYTLAATGDNQLDVELDTPKGRKVYGHPDGVIVKDCGENTCNGWLLEIKTTGEYPFKKLPVDGVPDYYRQQTWLYAMATHAPGAVFIYFDVSRGNLFRVEVGYRQAEAEMLLDKADLIWDHVESLEPPRPNPQTDWECRYCDWEDCPRWDGKP